MRGIDAKRNQKTQEKVCSKSRIPKQWFNYSLQDSPPEGLLRSRLEFQIDSNLTIE
jgi:hypothetical protein